MFDFVSVSFLFVPIGNAVNDNDNVHQSNIFGGVYDCRWQRVW